MLTFGVKAPDIARTKQLLAHIPGAAEKAISRAINRAIDGAKKEAISQVGGEYYTLSDAELRRGIKVMGASPKRLKATLIATSSVLRIAKFKIHEGRRLVTEIKKGRLKQWPHGFFAKMIGPYGNPHYGVFAREEAFTLPRDGRYKGKIKTKRASRGEDRGDVGKPIKRQQLFEGFTISIAEGVGHHMILGEIMNIAETRLDAELARQVNLFLSGKVT